jgi:hypothetical protein
MNRRRLGYAYSLCLVGLSAGLSGCSDDGPGAGPDAMSGPPVCNDGIVGEGELCDPGAGACCNATCDGYLAAGTECRAVAGACDVADTCTGTSSVCPDEVAQAGTACRPGGGTCDPAETCDGAAGECPANATTPDGTTCDDCVLGPGNCTTCSAGVCIPAGGVVVINELDSDTVTADDELEFIELYDGGVGNTPLDGLVLVLIDGANDTIYQAYPLDGRVTDASGYFVLGSGRLVPAVDYQLPLNHIQNGTDAVALYQGTTDDFIIGAAVTADGIMDAVVHGLAKDDELVALLTPGQPKLHEGSGGNAAGHSLQRVPDGAGGPRGTSQFVPAPPTPGAANQSSAP